MRLTTFGETFPDRDRLDFDRLHRNCRLHCVAVPDSPVEGHGPVARIALGKYAQVRSGRSLEARPT